MLDLGYMFDSYAHVARAMDSDAGKALGKTLLDRTGVQVLGWGFHFGARSVYTKKPVARLADLKDVKPFLTLLSSSAVPMVLMPFENPYLLTSVPNATAFLTTFSSSLPSEVAAVKALFGEIPITGHTPVSIPGFAQLGDGIQSSARSR